MTQEMDAADVERFHADGVVVLRGVISPDWLCFLEGAIRELEARPGPLAEKIYSSKNEDAENQSDNAVDEYFTDMEMAQRLPQFDTFSRRGPCAALAGEAMRSERVHFLYDQYFRQELNPTLAAQPEGERSGTPSTPWHQDQPYWSVSGSQVVSVWIPLDPTPSGCAVHFIKGSHRWREHSPFHFKDGEQYAGTGQPRLPDIDGGIAEGQFEVVSFPDAMPGDVVLFSAMMVHGQAPSHSPEDNNSVAAKTRFRRLAVRFTGDDARYLPRSGEAADVVPSRHFPCTLFEGDEMECKRFPLVWTRSDGLVKSMDEKQTI